jgi:hypothetical protein
MPVSNGRIRQHIISFIAHVYQVLQLALLQVNGRAYCRLVFAYDNLFNLHAHFENIKRCPADKTDAGERHSIFSTFMFVLPLE